MCVPFSTQDQPQMAQPCAVAYSTNEHGGNSPLYMR